MNLFKPLSVQIKELEELSQRQQARWPEEYGKAGKTPGQSYKPQEQLEHDAEADLRDEWFPGRNNADR